MEERRYAYASVSLSLSDGAGLGSGSHHPRPSAVERGHGLHLRHPHRSVPLIAGFASRRSDRSRRAKSISVTIAKRATRTAPSRTKGSLLATRPLKIGVPRVKAPTVEPMVAVPIAIVTETRTPARMTGAANGNS